MMTMESCVQFFVKCGRGRKLGLLLMLSMVMVLSACTGGPPPRLHLLKATASGPDAESPDVSSLRTLGISQVTVPGYASDARIASLSGEGMVVQMDAQRWAEEPEEAMTRYLAARLRQQAKATVLVEPWPRDYSPQARVEVDFGRLLREPDGGASMSGQILLLSGDGRKLLQSVEFDHRVAGRTTEAGEFFNAVAVGIDELVRLAIESLLQERRPS